MESVEILGYDGARHEFRINPMYRFVETEGSTKSRVEGRLVRTENPMENTHKLENAGISRVI